MEGGNLCMCVCKCCSVCMCIILYVHWCIRVPFESLSWILPFFWCCQIVSCQWHCFTTTLVKWTIDNSHECMTWFIFPLLLILGKGGEWVCLGGEWVYLGIQWNRILFFGLEKSKYHSLLISIYFILSMGIVMEYSSNSFRTYAISKLPL